MIAKLRHRGPDAQAVWVDAEPGLVLAHARLSIIDLSPAGAQPMHSASGRYVVVYNGEIYNWATLRARLESDGCAPAWRGHSDTEVLLACIEAWGFTQTLERLCGMFAIALWDRESRELTLARDRAGEKPLYYGMVDGAFVFASEIKALRAYPGFAAGIDRNALAAFLRFNYVPAPHSIFEGIRKLPAGAVLRVSAGCVPGEPAPYWDLRDVVRRGRAARFSGTPEQAVEELDTLLRRVVEEQMVADVPIGAFLSGGVDSSTIVAVMQAVSRAPVRTFSIGFAEDAYDESGYARAVALHLGTRHTEVIATPADLLAVVPRLPTLYCEPFADVSQVPTYLVSALARRDVTVSLSGDGGDELFAGYRRYALANRAWPALRWLPVGIRRSLGRLALGASPQFWDRAARPVLALVPRSRRPQNVGDKLHKAAALLDAESELDLYGRLVSQWERPEAIVPGAVESESLLRRGIDVAGLDTVERMMALDFLTYLPDDILVKVDRASMGVSLESRVPLLDARIVEFAWRLPMSLKVRDGRTKWVLREVLDRYVPRALIDRPKMGFGVPIDAWLRGALREWASDLLDPSRLRADGYFDAHAVSSRFDEHLSGRRNWQYQLWGVLMFQQWLADERG